MTHPFCPTQLGDNGDSQVGQNIYFLDETIGAIPHVISEQFKLWADYSQSQVGKTFHQMQPIDVWDANR